MSGNALDGGAPESYWITAIFAPKKTASLREDFKPYIGQRIAFRFAGTGSPNEDYPGQWRWMVDTMRGGPKEFWGWVPHEDLEDVQWQRP